jgi:hypothetical protein
MDVLHVTTDCSIDEVNVEPEYSEDSEESLENEIRVDAAGILRPLEMIPLWIKVISIATVSTIGIVLLGILFIVIIKFDFEKAAENRNYISTTVQLNQFMNGLFAEYDATLNILIHGDSADSQANLELQRKQLDTAIYQYNNDFLPSYKQHQLSNATQQYIQAINVSESALGAFRNNVFASNMTIRSTVDYFNTYAGAILTLSADVMNVLHVKADHTPLYVLALRYTTNLRKVRYIGARLMVRNPTVNAFLDFQRALAVYEEFAHEIKLEQKKIQKYITYVMRPSEELAVGYIEQLSKFNNTLNFTVSEWENVTSAWIADYDALGNYMRSTITSETDALVFSVVGKLCVAILVPILFFFFNIISIYALSFTVTGPWRRKNRRQELFIKKFVPSGLLSMIKCKSIADVTIGKHAQKNAVFVTARIITKLDENRPQETIKKLEKIFAYLVPFVRQRYGFVDRYTGEGFTCVFKSEKDAVHACEDIRQAADTYKDDLKVLLVVHTARVIACAIGEEDRLSGAFLSNHLSIISHIVRYGLSREMKIIITKDVYKRVKKEIKNIRYVGKCRDETLYEVFHISEHEKKQHMYRFREACRLMEEYETAEALQKFHECGTDPLVQERINTMKQRLIIEKLLIKSWTLEDTLAHPLVMKHFKEFCESEKNDENIQLWELIENYKSQQDAKERQLISKKIAIKYLSRMNLNESVKLEMKGKQEEKKQDDEQFRGLQLEILVLMKDSFARFKEKRLAKSLGQLNL